MARINRDDIDKFFDHNVYVPTRTVYIGSDDYDVEGGESGVTGNTASLVIKALHILDEAAPDGTKPIKIILNNPGGDSLHGMAIYDAIRLCKNHVTVVVQGYGMSIASWILQAADHRVMTVNSRIMLHTGTMSLAENHPEINKRWMIQFDKDEAVFEDILLEKIKQKHPTYDRKKIKGILRFDTILMPQEALDLGLIDEIV